MLCNNFSGVRAFSFVFLLVKKVKYTTKLNVEINVCKIKLGLSILKWNELITTLINSKKLIQLNRSLNKI